MSDPHPQRRLRESDSGHSTRPYSAEEIEFLTACERYRRAHQRLFLRTCDYLTVIHSLGYRKVES